MRRAWWCVALLVACSEPTVPSRSDVYGFDYLGDVFHWPADRLPVRFWADSGGPTTLVARGIAVWQAQFLYGEFTGILVSDSSRADVVVVFAGTVPDVPPDTGQPVVACQGVTPVPAVDSTHRFASHLYVHLSALGGYLPGQVLACLRRTTIHELGHALGILQESPDSGDIMHPPVTVDLPSERDHRTVEVLYHTPATILPAP